MDAGSRLPCDRAQLRSWMIDYITAVLAIPVEKIDANATFDSYGFDSVEAVVMAGVMEEEFGVPVDPIQLFEHPTIADFSARRRQLRDRARIAPHAALPRAALSAGLPVRPL